MEKIHSRMILEILGRPPEHLKESLKLLVEKVGKEEGVKILNSQIHEPIEVKDSKDLFTTFAEIELSIDTIEKYLGLIFAYLPANMELISPEKISISNEQITLLGTRLAQRLHDYDAIAKRTIMEKDAILKKLYEVAPHLFKREAPKVEDKIEKVKKESKKKKRK